MTQPPTSSKTGKKQNSIGFFCGGCDLHNQPKINPNGRRLHRMQKLMVHWPDLCMYRLKVNIVANADPYYLRKISTYEKEHALKNGQWIN